MHGAFVCDTNVLTETPPLLPGLYWVYGQYPVRSSAVFQQKYNKGACRVESVDALLIGLYFMGPFFVKGK